METFSALLAICAGNSPVPGEFPTQRPVTRSFDVFFDQHLNKRLSKRWWGWWFETLSRSLWRHRNASDRIKAQSLLLHVQNNWENYKCKAVILYKDVTQNQYFSLATAYVMYVTIGNQTDDVIEENYDNIWNQFCLREICLELIHMVGIWLFKKNTTLIFVFS